jgi:para-nitrobenzyl esterase
MKIARLLFGFVVMLAMTAISHSAIAGAQRASIHVGVSMNLPGSVLGRSLQAHRNPAPLAATHAVIVTENGPVGGSVQFGVERFLAIPYAAPPVGNLRWMPPQPHGKWTGVLKASDFGNRCTQPFFGGGGAYGSEDCLTLNVFVPLTVKNQNKKRPLPVMVWIHGGGLVVSGSDFFDPHLMVQGGNVIGVTINYRLGYLGFFAHPAIDSEGHPSGNYGLMDQQLALKWVQNNIAAFGGDPNRVTVFGESAGGQSVYDQLASPTAAGLFQRAISESGAYFQFQPYFNEIVPLPQGETVGTDKVPPGTAIAANAGCGDQTAQCLRALPATTLASMEPSNVYPFVDGTILTQPPDAALASGQFNRVPVISGGNHDENRLGVAQQYDFAGNPILTEAEYDSAVTAAYGSGLDAVVLFFYPYSSYPSGGVALAASETDVVFACPERNAVRSLSQYVTTYAYEFNDENAPDLLDPVPTFPLGAYHFAEVQYLFDLNVRFTGTNPFTPDQQQLSNTMISYWTQFAANGDPNSAGTPTWLPYHSTAGQFQSLVPPSPTVESGFDADHKCSSFWTGS